MRNTRITLLAASAMLAAASAKSIAMSGVPLRDAFKPQRLTNAPRGKRYPQMMTSSDEAIALHNATVFTRQVQRHRARHA